MKSMVCKTQKLFWQKFDENEKKKMKNVLLTFQCSFRLKLDNENYEEKNLWKLNLNFFMFD